METSPAKRRKTDHASFEAASAASGLFQPSTFILETAELLQQSRVDYEKLLPGSQDLLRDVKNAVESVEEHGPVLITKASADFEKKHSIRIPYPTPRPAADSLLKLSMAKPARCNVVGSFVFQTMARSQREFAVDLIVEMPRTLFQDKDYLNLRYFYKRAYYLARVAAAVAAAMPEPTLRLEFAYLGDNPLQPVLVATPTGKATTAKTDAAACKIRIIPCCPDGLFAQQKLLASKNCLRREAVEAGQEQPATPFYNATLKAEAAYVPYLKLLHQTQKSCAAFADACLLGRVWLQQRGFGGAGGRGGFGGFEWAALVALLLQTGRRKKSGRKAQAVGAAGTTVAPILSPSLNSTQIFKAVVQFLATTDLRSSSKLCILGASAAEFDGDLDSLREGSTPVLYDAGRRINVAYKMSPWSAVLLRQYAKATHALLGDESAAAEQFAATFIAKADVAAEAYDMVLRVRQSAGGSDTSTSTSAPRGRLWHFGDSVFQVLKKALGDRSRLVHIRLPALEAWPVDKAAGGAELPESLTISVGIVFDPANMARHIDHGPDAEDKKEARKFRQFWGERAELRRFKDGSIQETVVWAGRSAEALCEEIVRYILGTRLQVAEEDVVVLGGGSSSSSSNRSSLAALVPLAPTADAAAFALARDAFATLEQDLRGLEDLPLHIRQLAPVSPALRSATVHPPPVRSATAPLCPMEVVLFFEASGKWPDSLVAIQRAKIAFMLRIGASLEAAREGVVETHLGLEETAGDDGDSDSNDVAFSETQNLAFLDIVYADTAAFRLRIHCDLEASMLDRQARDRTLPPPARAAAAHRLAAHRRLFDHLPRHTQTVATLATRFPALSPTIRLAKRWFAAHKLLAAHVSDELVELLVLHVFLRPAPWAHPPASAAPGLLRTLQFLARWDWRADPLVVDTSAESNVLPPSGDETTGVATAEQNTDPRTRLAAWRKIDPAMNRTVLFVATSDEPTGTVFTTASDSGSSSSSRPLPSKVAAARMTSLARAATRLVRDGDSDGDVDVDPRLLFQPSLRDYDVLLHLAPRLVQRLVRGEVSADGDNESSRRSSVYKNLDGRTGRALHPLPAHPVRLLLDQLNQAYGAGAGAGPLVFFYSIPEDGDLDSSDYVVGATWNPQMHRRSFGARLPASFRPVKVHKKKKKQEEEENGDGDGSDNDDIPVEVNREAILAEVARIGGSLIQRIELVERHE